MCKSQSLSESLYCEEDESDDDLSFGKKLSIMRQGRKNTSKNVVSQKSKEIKKTLNVKKVAQKQSSKKLMRSLSSDNSMIQEQIQEIENSQTLPAIEIL